MLDTIYHMTLKLISTHISGVKMSRFSHFFSQLYNRCHYIMLPNSFLILLHGVISHLVMTSCDK